jgi:hypothetical protein
MNSYIDTEQGHSRNKIFFFILHCVHVLNYDRLNKCMGIKVCMLIADIGTDKKVLLNLLILL